MSASSSSSLTADYLADVPSTLDVDKIIDQLLSVRGQRPGRQVDLPESQIKCLLFIYLSCNCFF